MTACTRVEKFLLRCKWRRFGIVKLVTDLTGAMSVSQIKAKYFYSGRLNKYFTYILHK